MRRLFYLLLTVVFSACSSYEYLSIDALIPAKYSIPPEIKSVVIVNNSPVFRGKDVHKIKLNNRVSYLDTIWYDDFGLNVVNTLKEELIARKFYDTVYVDNSGKYATGTKLTPSQVYSICKDYNAEGVIALQRYFYNTVYNIDEYDVITVGSLDVNSVLLWVMHNNISGKPEVNDLEKDTISWTADGPDIMDMANNLPGIKSGLEELSYYVGGKSADLFAPYWQTQKRVFYAKGKFGFMQATELVRNNKWREAMQIWKSIYDSSQKKTKERAAFNLAVGAEILGDFVTAKAWIKQCYDILKVLPDNVVLMQDKMRMEQYYAEIVKRLEQSKDLKSQIGGGL